MKKERKNNLADLRRNRNPLYPELRTIKLNCCLSVKDVNTSEVFMFDQTATKKPNTLTPTKAARSAIDYVDFD